MNKKKFPSQMTTEELEKLASEEEGEFLWERTRPLTKEERARWKEIKRGRGRPRKGEGAKAISVTVEKKLLRQTDALAARLYLTRADLISRGLVEQLRKHRKSVVAKRVRRSLPIPR